MRAVFVGFVLFVCATGLWGDTPQKAAPVPAPDAKDAKKPIAVAERGYVFAVSVSAWPGGQAGCSATICEDKNGEGERTHVSATDHRIQTALESAAARKVLVEVTYHLQLTPGGIEERIVGQVVTLDLPERQPKAKPKK